jgi:hypothetical protein
MTNAIVGNSTTIIWDSGKSRRSGQMWHWTQAEVEVFGGAVVDAAREASR